MTFWIAGAGLAMGAIGMAGSSATQSAAASGAIATTKGQLKVQKANQSNENAKAGFANFMTAFNNNRQLTQFGKAKAAAQSNASLAKDNATATTFEQRLQQSEARGALAANMGFSGSAGASFDAIEGSARLRDARVNQNVKDGKNQLNYAMAQQQLGLIDNGLMGLDMTVNSGGVNASVMAPAVTGGTNYLSAIANSNILDSVGKIAAAWPGGGLSRTANLTGGGLGLKTGGGAGLTMPSASTSFFNLGNTASVNYSLF
uniref:Uncharacterized protein n=1 Tax=feces metagenome TaxID=1861841 RepID=A0A7M2QN20_9ZZZZ